MSYALILNKAELLVEMMTTDQLTEESLRAYKALHMEDVLYQRQPELLPLNLVYLVKHYVTRRTYENPGIDYESQARMVLQRVNNIVGPVAINYYAHLFFVLATIKHPQISRTDSINMLLSVKDDPTAYVKLRHEHLYELMLRYLEGGLAEIHKVEEILPDLKQLRDECDAVPHIFWEVLE